MPVATGATGAPLAPVLDDRDRRAVVAADRFDAATATATRSIELSPPRWKSAPS